MNPLALVNSVTRIAILALLLPVSLLAAQNPDSSCITKLLAEVKVHAALADDDAATLASYTQSNLNWRTHGVRLNQIKEHVNDLIRDGNQLSSMRAEGSLWQQEAIDGFTPLLPVIAEHLTATIIHLKENRTELQFPAYRDYVLANEKMINKANHAISDWVDYGEAKERADSLEKELQLSGSSNKGD